MRNRVAFIKMNEESRRECALLVACSSHARRMLVACSSHARCMLVACSLHARGSGGKPSISSMWKVSSPAHRDGMQLSFKCTSSAKRHLSATFQPFPQQPDENGARLGMSDKHSPKRHGRRHSKCPHLVRPGRPFVAVYCAAFPPGELAVAAPPRVRRERSRPTSPSRREEIRRQ